jgi:CRP/FNR family transcriptional regulator
MFLEYFFEHDIYSGIETYYYQAMTKVEFYTIRTDVLVENFQKNKLIMKDVLREIGLRLQFNIQRQENIALVNAYDRTAHQLVYLAQRFGEIDKRGTKIVVPLTQQDLSDVLSLTRETTSRALSRLRKKGLILSQKNIIIPDIDKLTAVYSGI